MNDFTNNPSAANVPLNSVVDNTAVDQSDNTLDIKALLSKTDTVTNMTASNSVTAPDDSTSSESLQLPLNDNESEYQNDDNKNEMTVSINISNLSDTQSSNNNDIHATISSNESIMVTTTSASIARKRPFMLSESDQTKNEAYSNDQEARVANDNYVNQQQNQEVSEQHIQYQKKGKFVVTSSQQSNLLENDKQQFFDSSEVVQRSRQLVSLQQYPQKQKPSPAKSGLISRLRRSTRLQLEKNSQIKTVTSSERLQTDGTMASCSESQSSTNSSVSTPTHRTNTAIELLHIYEENNIQEQIKLHQISKPTNDEVTRTLTISPLHRLDDLSEMGTDIPSVSILAPVLLRTNSRGDTVASSEEDSVAEMDYISENSHISVADKDLLHAETEITSPIPLHCLPSVPSIGPNRAVNEASSLVDSSGRAKAALGLSSHSRPIVATVPIPKVSRNVRSNSKDKPLRTKLSKAAVMKLNTDSPFNLVTGKSSFETPGPDPPTAKESLRYNTVFSSIGDSHDDDGHEEDAATTKNETISYPIQIMNSDDRALFLPKFPDPRTCMWTASHAANCPSEDRSSSLVHLLLQPLPPNFDSETQLLPLEPDYKTLIRLNLWAVIDGHGGGCVATYASEVLLPHIAASVSRALGCAIVDRGVCTVNGQLRDANALDLDGLIQTHSDRAMSNPNSIHYRSPYERSDSDVEEECDNTNYDEEGGTTVPQTARERKHLKSLIKATEESTSVDEQPNEKDQKGQHVTTPGTADATVSSIKTSVKTTASVPAGEGELIGTHSPREVAAITRAITESFLAVDEAWINSIDPVATHQTSCQSNGRWNSGACALVVFTVQRLVWTSVSEPDREKESMDPEKSRRNTTQNRDAARRRMLDYASRTKSASSMSTVSSTSSLTTEEAAHASGIESEITETEGEDDDRSFENDVRKRDPVTLTRAKAELEKACSLSKQLSTNSGHCYRAHTAMIYTAHVGDCRAVLLGSAPPRTIKVGDFSSLHQDTTDDESSHHSSDETECLSSSDHDADSSEEEEIDPTSESTKSATAASSFMNFPKRVVRQRNAHRRAKDDSSGPFIALPPLEESTTVEFDFEPDMSRRRNDVGRRTLRVELSDSSSTSSQDSIDLLPIIHLPPGTRPIDLTTDHSAYNPAEVTAVLRRCNNAPRAISAGVGGGIKRVAGSLAVTRALGDAYLKTPKLSFLPYKSHAPYITGRPEVNCRPLLNAADKVLILATDGVWERASGEDVLRWVRNFYEERLAEAARRATRRSSTQLDKSQTQTTIDNEVSNESLRNNAIKNFFQQQEGSERDLFDHRTDSVEPTTISTSSRKSESATTGSPIQNNNPTAKRRRRGRYTNANNVRVSYNVADVIVRRVLNKVRQARNISSLQALMSLPQGRARRSKHDDITGSVVDLSAFIS